MSIGKLPHRQPFLQQSGARARLVFGLVVFAALAIRLLYLWGQVECNPMLNFPATDTLQHHQWAQSIASGQDIGRAAYYRAPLYCYLLGLLYAIVGPSVVAGKLMGCVIGTISCYLIGSLTRSLAGTRAGIWAAALAALYWPFIYFDAELLTVSLEICLNTLTLLLLVHAGRQQKVGWFVAAGIALGLAALTRPTILAFLPCVAIGCMLVAPQPARWRFILSRTAAVFLAAGIVILPVTIRNYVASGEFVLVSSSAGINFYIGNNAKADGATAKLPGAEGRWDGNPQEPRQLAEGETGRSLSDSEVSKHYFSKGRAWIRENPLDWAKLLLKKFRCFWIPYELPNNQSIVFFACLSPISVIFWIGFPVAVILAGGGVVAVRHRWRLWFPLIAFVVVLLFVNMLFFCPARFRLPVVPVLLAFAGAGLAFLFRRLRHHQPAKLKGYLLVSAGCGALMAGSALGGDRLRQIDMAGGHYRFGLFFAKQEANDDGEPDYERAIAELKQAVELDHPGTSARLALARALSSAGQIAEAESEYRRAVSDFPDDVTAQRRFGEFLATQQRDAEAVRCFSRAVKIDPLSAESHQELGCLFIRMGRLRQAIEHLRKARRLDSRLMRAAIFLSQAHAMQGDYDAAIDLLHDYLQWQPNSTGVLLAMGNTQVNAGRPQDAIESYEKAAAVQPNVPEVTYGHAMALRLTGRRAEAARILESQVKATPNDPECLTLLAWIRATAQEDSLRDGREAASLANRAITRMTPPSPEALDAQAAAYAEQGRFDDAVRVARAAQEAATQARRPALARKIGNRIRMYTEKQSYRE